MNKTLKNKKWTNHRLAKQGYVAEFPVELLDAIRYQDSTEYTDLPNGDIHHQNIIFDSIENDGMEEPLVIVISPTNMTIRLESGNHIIKVAIDRGYTHLPCSLIIFEKGIIHKENGDHLYPLDFNIINKDNLLGIEKTVYPIYIDPFSLFKNINLIKNKND
jgi:hypothetical protein